MSDQSILKAVLIFLMTAGSSALAQRVNHLPKAPSWDYGVAGAVAAAPVGTDYCDMSTGNGCMGANVLISGASALVIFNQLPVTQDVNFRKARGIECALESASGAVRCLFHVTETGTRSGELPWISD